jgi:hypothetical protein
LIDVAIILGVSQTDLENGYYMVDLPSLLSTKRKHDAANRLGEIVMRVATNNRGMEETEYKTFIRGLNKEAGVKQSDKFDREKFEQLRQFAK